MKVRIAIDGLLLVVRPENQTTRTTLRTPPFMKPYYTLRKSRGAWEAPEWVDAGSITVTGDNVPTRTTLSANSENPGMGAWTIVAPTRLPKLIKLQGQTPSPGRGALVTLPHGLFGAALPGYIGTDLALFRRFEDDPGRWLAAVALLEIEGVSELRMGAATLCRESEGTSCDLWIRCGDLRLPPNRDTDPLPNPWRLDGLGALHSSFDPPTAFAPLYFEATAEGSVERGENGPSPPGNGPMVTNVFCPPPTWP